MNHCHDERKTTMHIRSKLLTMLFLIIPALATADDDGRYQAVVLHSAGVSSNSGALSPKVFILDTRDGHMWTWEQNARVRREKGNISFGNILTYQGKLRPGRHAGEVISESK